MFDSTPPLEQVLWESLDFNDIYDPNKALCLTIGHICTCHIEVQVFMASH